MNYDDLLSWLYSTQLFGFKLGLDGPRQLLRRFKAYPQPGVKVIHVAGTNGKGSTCAMAESIARACGYKTGLFTSPHLVDFRERIRVNGEMIDREELTVLLEELHALVTGWDPHPTFFELALALALKYFRQQEVELIFLETGMGGRLDATNAVPKDIAVLTPVGMDHTQYLGDTLEKIAWEKAEIIAEGKPVVTARQHPDVFDVIEQIAIERRAPLTEVTLPLLGYHIPLPGVHQQENAALAAATLHALGLEIRSENVADGLSNVRWPGRFEETPDGFILDGAHNAHALPVLLDTWKNRFGGKKTAIVFSAVEDKDVSAVLKGVSQLAESIHFAPINSPRAATPENLAKKLPPDFTGKIHIHHDLSQALEDAKSDAVVLGLPPLVTGSLYLIGEVKGLLNGTDTVPTAQ